MGDLVYLEDYLAEAAQAPEESKSVIEQLLDAPLGAPNASDPVKVDPGENATEKIEQAKKQKNFLSTATDAKNKSEKLLGAAVPDLSDLPTAPSGGIGLLVFISLLIVFAITPVGKTGLSRLTLLWQAVLGNYTYQGADSSTVSQPTSGFDAEARQFSPALIQGGLY